GSIDQVMIWNRSFTDAEVYQLYASNLYKFNSTQWYLVVNQSKNTSDALDHGNYTYFVSAKNTTNWENLTDIRTININKLPSIIFATPANNTNTTDTSLDVNFTITSTNALSSCWYSNDSYLVNITFACGQNITNVTWSEAKHNVTVYTNDSTSSLAQKTIVFTVDTSNPNITLLVPDDGAGYTANSQTINFGYNASDNQNIANCSLTVNAVVNLTNSSINKSVFNNFSQTFSTGTYNWNINCTDYSTNKVNSSTRSFTITAPAASSSSSEPGGLGKSSTEKTDQEEENIIDETSAEEQSYERTTFPDITKNIDCVSNYECSEWSGCHALYTTNTLIDARIILEGEQTRTCEDDNGCAFSRIEQKKCDPGQAVQTKKVSSASMDSILVYTPENLLVSTVEIAKDDERVNIIFSLQ
ncbi:MAG: hypothetical protein AABX16_01035, partial [Nanoarchaeota archaeon]